MRAIRVLRFVALLATGSLALGAIYGLGAVGTSGQYELLWGTQLFAGERVELGAPFAPTPHPLTIAIAGLVAQLGGVGVVALSITQFVALAGMLVALWLFAAELFDRRVATLSIALLALCPQILLWSFDGPKSSLWIIALALAGRAELRATRAGGGCPVAAGAAGSRAPGGMGARGPVLRVAVVRPRPAASVARAGGRRPAARLDGVRMG